jgi:hypothetical protein
MLKKQIFPLPSREPDGSLGRAKVRGMISERRFLELIE